MSKESSTAHVKALVLDATPLITHPYSHYQGFAQAFYTTPTVFNEIKDERARKNLEIWQSLGSIELRHPSQESIERISKFAKLTGDFSVLSANDIHILALSYDLEVELNEGDWRLRKQPGDDLNVPSTEEQKDATNETENAIENSDTEVPVAKKKNRRRGGKKQRAKREAEAAARATEEATATLETGESESVSERLLKEEDEEAKNEATQENLDSSEQLNENTLEDEDDGEWITPDNLTKTIIKDSGADTEGSRGVEATEAEKNIALNLPGNQVALATGDFAIQNVALQMNLNLMNFMSGLKIKRLRNYMSRCHACFRMFPMPKDGKPLHFCPSCGGQGTLLRCAVSVDSKTGNITPHLKRNFQWSNRGVRYSIASPLSKNSQKKYGKKGYVHSKPQTDGYVIREDQKEYEKLMKQEDWTRRHNEKVLENWIGGGSADNYMSPFAISGLKHHSVKVGRSRYVNSNNKKK
ncbi:hypothetical protein TPHA_0J01320 [Tetrapisispora phaffii CBS 4417]|uniref:20S-pre-rRNA D-site endonuclease NOB1 n=1 Tax=Tetrapisispora phaffii (strain ATCC 24235 / CBS 4417 / NBRC 1672 / NRRL Y-8282 / UCD 70-5) TaxID=1071381 RepID=G8BYL2_TETPH|nr:hypothetical protein TPHA_0J01320 [Tetrapisispora phaffii CBS 4417]CCE64954.1 hypothetical protein TPHA_0J01320 [Tetrapisispora phaffii CBS 4417]